MRHHNQHTSKQDNLISLMLGGIGHHRIQPKRVGDKIHITTYSKIDIDDFEEFWGVPHICPDMHSGQIPHPRGERLVATLNTYRVSQKGCRIRAERTPAYDTIRQEGRIWIQPCGAFDWKHLMLVVAPK